MSRQPRHLLATDPYFFRRLAANRFESHRKLYGSHHNYRRALSQLGGSSPATPWRRFSDASRLPLGGSTIACYRRDRRLQSRAKEVRRFAKDRCSNDCASTDSLDQSAIHDCGWMESWLQISSSRPSAVSYGDGLGEFTRGRRTESNPIASPAERRGSGAGISKRHFVARSGHECVSDYGVPSRKGRSPVVGVAFAQ